MIPLRDDNPTRSFAVVTFAIAAANVVAFLLAPSLAVSQSALLDAYALNPRELTHFARNVGGPHLLPFLTILTSMFLHGGILHLGGNMLYLWIFGNNIEDSMGRMRFPIFYILTGAGAALLHIALYPDSTTPTIGASGAVSGVLGAYIRLFPHARVLTAIPSFYYIRLVRIPAYF
ncbi:MAG: rhomboid family intramembrane serine protease, partial [Vicinamibacteria bacterium]